MLSTSKYANGAEIGTRSVCSEGKERMSVDETVAGLARDVQAAADQAAEKDTALREDLSRRGMTLAQTISPLAFNAAADAGETSNVLILALTIALAGAIARAGEDGITCPACLTTEIACVLGSYVAAFSAGPPEGSARDV
jgi:hypothetical protein